jgi:protein-S-isoprenylcysteine O-methyltransferase Ste14
MNPQLTPPKGRRELRLPRWAVPIVWAILVLVILVVLPWAVSRLGPRYVGLMMYVWCLVFHFKSYRDSVRVGFSPPHLVVTGPYRVSRNPMYVAGLFAWIGWAVFYGSPAVFFGLVLLWLLFTFRVIPYEERQLEALFGDEYREYKKSVRRWIGRI